MEYMAKERECRHTEDTGESDHTAKGECYFNLISIAAEGHHVTPTFSFHFSYILETDSMCVMHMCRMSPECNQSNGRNFACDRYTTHRTSQL